MLRYEALMLAVPEITQDEVKNIETSINAAIVKGGGSMVSFERWGKYRLAYPVKKNDYGIYFLTRFEVENAEDVLKGLRSLFTIKLNTLVMRNMVSVLDINASLAYQRPQSLEETPARDVGSFIRENKMEGIMSVAQKRAQDDVSDEKEVKTDVEEAPESTEAE